jgi:predicted CoA-substrate-specific enzyme activase
VIYLGVDVGSVSTNVVAVDAGGEMVTSEYLLTQGNPIEAVQRGLGRLRERLGAARVSGVGTTGSGRQLAACVVGADVVKNEITAHAVAAMYAEPGVQTVLEIGGQDSKLIILRQGVVVDFAMNTVCAAGTGSFLDRQAARLGLDISELGCLAEESEHPVHIAGRCAVFAESDMIHKQQVGHDVRDIVRGLCEALVRNYLSNVGKSKEILPPVLFQGGVAANQGIVAAFQRELGVEIKVPAHHMVMGALGAALLARESGISSSRFRGFEAGLAAHRARSYTCPGCANACEIVELSSGAGVVGRWGGKCGRHEGDALVAGGA